MDTDFEKLLNVGAISDFSYDCDLEDEMDEDQNRICK